MSEPYSVSMVRTILKRMPSDRLAELKPKDFHQWPTRKIVPAQIIDEMLTAERAARKA